MELRYAALNKNLAISNEEKEGLGNIVDSFIKLKNKLKK